jgi:hypothetical protein
VGDVGPELVAFGGGPGSDVLTGILRSETILGGGRVVAWDLARVFCRMNSIVGPAATCTHSTQRCCELDLRNTVHAVSAERAGAFDVTARALTDVHDC